MVGEFYIYCRDPFGNCPIDQLPGEEALAGAGRVTVSAGTIQDLGQADRSLVEWLPAGKKLRSGAVVADKGFQMVMG